MNKSDLIKLAAARIVLSNMEKVGIDTTNAPGGAQIIGSRTAPAAAGAWNWLTTPMKSVGGKASVPINSPLGGFAGFLGLSGVVDAIKKLIQGNSTRQISYARDLNRQLSPMVNEMYNRNALGS